MPSRYRVANQYGLFFATAIFLLVAAGVLWGTQRFIGDADSVSHTNQVIATIDSIEARLRDAESAQRGYLLTGQVGYLADYRTNREALQPKLGELRALVGDSPGQMQRAAALERSAAQRFAQMETTLAAYAADGLAAAQTHIGSEVMQVSRDIRRHAHEMLEVEQALLAQRAVSSRRSADILRAFALLGIPLGILMVGLVYWALVREVRLRAKAEHGRAETNQQLQASVRELEHNSEHLRELSRYGGLLQICMDSHEAILLASQLFSRLLPETGGTLYRIRASQDYAEEVAHWGRHAAHGAAMLPPRDCWALRRGQTHVLRAGDETLRCTHVELPRIDIQLNTACIPLTAQGVQLGFIYLSGHDGAFLSRLELAEAAAEQLSMALSNLELRERLRVQSIREPLTGLFNRRYLEESLSRELARCQRRGLPLALMMLDLDHFKRFNDTHGHVGGDALLAQFGQLLQSLSRPEDIACRYGGEEFTLILPEAGVTAALERAETIRAAVETMVVRHLGKDLPNVTVSIGVACHPDHGQSTEALLRCADEALYRGKHEGRNRVMLAERSG